MRDQLKRAYPKTPVSFEARMEQVLSNLPERSSRRGVRRTVAIALAAAITMCGLAVAATQSLLLDVLFRGESPTPQAEILATELGAAAEVDGATLTIDEYLLDGSDLYVRWTVASTSDEPLMLLVSDVQTPYPAETIIDNNYCSWTFGTGILLTPEYPTHSEVSRIHFDEETTADPFDATFTAALLRPTARILDADAVAAFSDTPTLLQTDFGNGMTGLHAASTLSFDGEDSYEMNANDLYEAVDGPMTFDSMLSALKECGYAEETVRIPVHFTIEPDEAHIVHTEIVGQSVFIFEDYMMIVDRADFTAAGVNVQYRLFPRDTGEVWNSLASRIWFEVLPDGERADNQFVQGKSSADSVIDGDIVARAGSTIPSSVRLVPYIEETNERLPQYAVELQLRTVPEL